MRTPAQQTASRANGARSRGPKTQPPNPRTSMDAPSLDLLTKTTVLKSESRKGFHELVRKHMLRFAPRDAVEQTAVEEICSATWRLHRLRAIERKAIDLAIATQSSPDNLECLVHACGNLAGKNSNFHVLLQRYETRLQNIIRRSPARIRVLRQIDERKEFDQTAPVGHSSGAPPAGPAGGPHCAPEP